MPCSTLCSGWSVLRNCVVVSLSTQTLLAPGSGGMHVCIPSADFYYNFKSVVQNSNMFRLLFPSIQFTNIGSKKCPRKYCKVLE